MKKEITDILGLVSASGFVSRTELIGCDEAEVKSLELRFGLNFPPVYKSFLLTMGRRIGPLLSGDDVYYDVLDRLQCDAVSWANEKNPEMLDSSPFFFYGHQGYEFAFFTSRGEDPPIYVVSDSMPVPQLVDENLSGALYQLIERAIHDYAFVRNVRQRHAID